MCEVTPRKQAFTPKNTLSTFEAIVTDFFLVDPVPLAGICLLVAFTDYTLTKLSEKEFFC